MLASDTGPAEGPSAATSCPVEAIAAAYLSQTSGDPALALRCAITDALADLLEAERRTREHSRLISRGLDSETQGSRSSSVVRSGLTSEAWWLCRASSWYFLPAALGRGTSGNNSFQP